MAKIDHSLIIEKAVSMMGQALESVCLDRERVTHAFATQMEALKLLPRPVLFHPNLSEAAARLGSSRNRAVTWTGVRGAAKAAAWDAVRDAGWEAARDEAWKSPWAAGNAAWDAARGAAGESTWAAAWDAANAIWAVSRNAFWDATRDAAWDAAWDAALNGVPPPSDDHFIVAARCFLEVFRGGALRFWIASDAVYVVLARIHTEHRPVTLGRQNLNVRRLHRDDGPAIEYEDGSGLYFWKGIQVPEQVILRPDKVRVKDILAEPNAEVRRAMMDRYGQDRFVLDAGAKVLDKWKGNELLVIDLPDDPDRDLVALKLRCPSTETVYILRVPPDQRTVQGALAWSFGLDKPEDYVLQKET